MRSVLDVLKDGKLFLTRSKVLAAPAFCMMSRHFNDCESPLRKISYA